MLRKPGALSVSTALTLATFAVASTQGAEPAPVDFGRDVKPLLSNRCFRCHGPDATERKGSGAGLRLDTHAGATALVDGAAAIVPGRPEDSELIRRITSTDPDVMMPPPASGARLSPGEIRKLTDWVRDGARYANHWSFERPVRPELPEVQNERWVRNAIDRFILQRLEAEGLSPQPEVDRRALARRAALDLTGLPPRPNPLAEFLADRSNNAYERYVDRLLDDEAYGEHWAHLWGDLARYADSAGYADDPPRTIWLFRDYVIRSLNANKPFDQFTVEQLAGDLLPNPSEEQIIATAFHRNTLTNNEGGTNDEEFRNVAIVDRVNTTFAVWMGVTMACAQCHSHKYDPISQEEYFKVFAIFNQSEDADRGDEQPLHSKYTDEQLRQKSGWEMELASVNSKLATPNEESSAAAAAWEAAFPHELSWKPAPATAASSKAGSSMEITPDGSVFVAKTDLTDTYKVTVALPAGPLRAIRLHTLPDARLPGSGPGHAVGNFVLTDVTATIVPPNDAPPTMRFVRVELPGQKQYLSLAEVQVFAQGQNVALKGEATQSSTWNDGSAARAIDGETNGHYFEAKSTTHTDQEASPWWEVDLKADQSVSQIVVWNRTDGAGERLKGARLRGFDSARTLVFESTLAEAPSPSEAVNVSGRRAFPMHAAVADFSQNGFAAANLADAPNQKRPRKKDVGWAIAGGQGQPHALTLVSNEPIDVAEGSTLVVEIEQASAHHNHTLGSFRFDVTDDAQAKEYGQTPAPVHAALRLPKESRSPEQLAAIFRHFSDSSPYFAPDRKQRDTLSKQLADLKPVTVPVMRELPPERRRVTKLQHRGNFLDVGDVVEPGTPNVFPPLPTGESPNRLALAKWLVAPENPLTARVIANRFWEQLFGIGLVSTSEEFGAQGELPSHPELLDWLAVELVERQWNVKAFLRLLVTSAAYRQSADVSPAAWQRDPDNRLLARGPRFRLSAEMVRDQALAVSGLLSRKQLGPSVKPPQPNMGLSAAFGGGIDWQTSSGEDKYRRAVYTTLRRSNPYPSMTTFDSPNREVCTLRRGRTNTPLQALVTLNDPVFIEAAQALARRVLTSPAQSDAERASWLFEEVLLRPPTAAERSRLTALLDQTRQELNGNLKAAESLASDPLGPPPKELAVIDLAAWTVAANVMLNLDETLMKK